ncbi:MAG TPA: diguanylate cyclase [Thermoleophilaceae bacterium]|nr:diguanylate cyclase [Thermoleophilaceae bacterium]
MTFRGRLRLFFAIIVIVPMIAVAIVLFALSESSETGKADAAIAAGLRSAMALYSESSERAEPELRRVARDPRIRSALQDGLTERTPLDAVLRDHPGAVEISLTDLAGRTSGTTVSVFRGGAGSPPGVAPKSAPLRGGGRPVGRLAVSVTSSRDYVRRLERLSGLEASVAVGEDVLASTVPGARPTRLGGPESSREVQFGSDEYRGRAARIHQPTAPPVTVAVFQSSEELDAAIADNRRVIFGILLGFFLLALLSSALITRALQEQIQKFLAAARRLARGDFAHPVPTEGGDEFAELGREFNSMSEQLEAKIQELGRKREELEETIRRVGDAFATGLDRQGVVALAVKTAVDACEADAGRAFPLERGVFSESRAGVEDSSLDAALMAAERAAFRIRPDVGSELLEQVESDSRPLAQRSAVPASANGAFGLAMPLRARLGSGSSGQYVGVVSIARRGREFSHPEEKLLEYLAAQAAVSIENTDLHQTVQRQAVTDELTGLWNVRQFHEVLDHEVERARRFEGSLGLAMLDIDDFKAVNDTYGHQQGDQMLAAVARVLRELSRDIDTPARYGGEEMAVVLPGTDAEGAAQLAERMREAVEELRVARVDGAGQLKITASFGVASIPVSAVDKDSLIAAADAALYRAKRAGKNRVERADTVAAAG